MQGLDLEITILKKNIANMTATLEQFCVPEPKWILDRQGSGQGELFWRREAASKCRVKFRFDVEIKEFCRQEHEFSDPDPQLLHQLYLEEATDRITMGITCLVCMAVTVLLPWYIIGV